MKKIICAITVILVSLGACERETNVPQELKDQQFQQELIENLIDARPGDIIELPAGRYEINRSLSLRVDGITIRGAGMDKTILSFSNQISGAEGLLVNANNFVLEALAIENTLGDAVKVNGGENITIRKVRVEWTGGPKTGNGAYGLYPVKTKNVLIEDCVAIGASDAGIYVGQSDNVIVRRNRAEFNVAGIEIENTINADVYENIATNNTGGILVFNMPELEQAGGNTRVFDNDVYENNTKNFGHAGTPVASIPAGSGIVINSNDKVEIFNNRIKDNKTSNLIISSLYTTGYADNNKAKHFDAYPESIFIYNNLFEGGGNSPDQLDLKLLKTALFGPLGKLPDVLWDGYIDKNKMQNGVLPDHLKICMQNGESEIINVDAPNKFKNPRLVGNEHRCELEKITSVQLPEQMTKSN